MKHFGDNTDGVQHKQKGKLQIRTQSKTVAEVDSSGISGYISSSESGIMRNPSIITSDAEIKANENACLVGPITVSATLTVSGTLQVI